MSKVKRWVFVNGYGLVRFKSTESVTYSDGTIQLHGKIKRRGLRSGGGKKWIEHDYWYTAEQVFTSREEAIQYLWDRTGISEKSISGSFDGTESPAYRIPEHGCESTQYGNKGVFEVPWESSDTYPANTEVYGDLAGTSIRHHKTPDTTETPQAGPALHTFRIVSGEDLIQILFDDMLKEVLEGRPYNIATIKAFSGDTQTHTLSTKEEILLGTSTCFLGRTLEEAQAILAAFNIQNRVSNIDGYAQVLTCDLKFDRVNFTVQDGKVVHYTLG